MLGRFIFRRRMMRQAAGRMMMRRMIRRMVWRRVVVILAAVLLGYLAVHARAQAVPAGGMGGLSPEDQQALQDQMQLMQGIQMQVLQNMQNAGVDPQAFMQDIGQQMQAGTLDMAGLQQQMVQKGFMTQQQSDQISGGLTRLQGIARNISLNSIKTQLNATDDEWAVLLPKIQKIIELLPDVRPANPLTPNGNRGGVRLGGGGMGGMAMGQAAPTTDTGKAFLALQEVLKDVNASEDRMAAKLSAWREFHRKSEQQLKQAREDLISIVTLRQEALLVGMGVL